MSSTTTIIALALVLVALLAILSGLLAYTAARRVSPEGYRHYEQTLADMQLRLERTEQRSDRQQERIDQLQEALEAEQNFSRAVVRVLRDAGLEPPSRPEPPAPPVVDGAAGLARKIAARFSLDEMAGLALELQLDGVLTGDSLETRASSLVMAAMRRGVVGELVALARRERPRGGF